MVECCIDLGARFVKTDDVLTRAIGNELVLLHTARAEYFGLSGIGLFVFLSFTAGKSFEEVVSELEGYYPARARQIRYDIAKLTLALLDTGCLREISSEEA